jgi:hypothetical protein
LNRGKVCSRSKQIGLETEVVSRASLLGKLSEVPPRCEPRGEIAHDRETETHGSAETLDDCCVRHAPGLAHRLKSVATLDVL